MNNYEYRSIGKLLKLPSDGLGSSKTIYIKGTVCVFLSDPRCKDGNARFTTVPLNTLI